MQRQTIMPRMNQQDRDCLCKVRFETREECEAVIAKRIAEGKCLCALEAYTCSWCRKYHMRKVKR